MEVPSISSSEEFMSKESENQSSFDETLTINESALDNLSTTLLTADSETSEQIIVPHGEATHLLITQDTSGSSDVACKGSSIQTITVDNISKDFSEIVTSSLSSDGQNNKHNLYNIPDDPKNLDQFMDVVTTYKCKFCPFSCQWKSGLVSHIRSTHLELAQKTVAEAPPPPQPEKQIFLCGQCSQGFCSLDDCKYHMIKDHHLTFGNEATEEEQITKRPPIIRRKRKPLPRRLLSCVPSPLAKEPEIKDELEKNDSGIIISRKRKIRRPRILEEEYVLGRRKRMRRSHENTDERPFRCVSKGCGFRFRLETNLEYHLKSHSSEDRYFTCPECEEKFENWRSLAIHLWKKHELDIDLHTCFTCGYKTHSLFKLESHKRIHSDERSFVCSICGKGFKQMSQLRNHCVIHMDRKNIKEKRWYSNQECDLCHRVFADSKCLRKHRQTVHNRLKPYICSYCGHASARKAMLELHIRQHTGEKPFQCELCEYRTGDHNSMRRHKMRHSGEKPYKCPHCSYACIQAISYKTHLKNKHPGKEGLFSCPLCAYKTVNKENFMNHIGDHKRGIIPTKSSDSLSTHIVSGELSTIESVLPGNISAAHLLYSALNAISNDAAQNLPHGMASSSSTEVDGHTTHTITIQIPSANSNNLVEPLFVTIQPQNVDNGQVEETSEQLIDQQALENNDKISDDVTEAALETIAEYQENVNTVTYETPSV